MFSEADLRKIYHWKIVLLLNGLRITQKFLDKIQQYESDFNKGRKGGAGPAGGRYFMFENGSLANVALWGPQSEQSHLLLQDISGYNESNPQNLKCTILNTETQGKFILDLIPVPIKYNTSENLNGTTNKQIALVHGDNCLASTVVQKCRYWEENNACAFCGIEFSLQDGSTIEKKTPEQLIHAINSASEQNLCSHMTLTMGTLSKSDKGAEDYFEIVSKIKQQYPELPIHIQIEPFDDISKLNALKNAGVDTIGVHLEIPDDAIRKKYCPGKFATPREVYEKFWLEAVEVFGKGQVSTFIILGFGESVEDTISYMDYLVKLGVIPNIMPVRYILGTELDYKPINLHDLVRVYDSVAEAFLRYGLDPHNNKAGCIKCRGCSAIMDAYDYHKKTHPIS